MPAICWSCRANSKAIDWNRGVELDLDGALTKNQLFAPSVEDLSLTTIRAHFESSRRSTPSALTTVAVVCLVLLALLAVAQVTHVHAVGSDPDHCQLCIVMHSVVPFVVFVAGVLLVRIGTAAPVLCETRTIARYWHPILFNRPPPVGC
jgi:hypothetical protein